MCWDPHINVPYYYWLLLAHFTLEEYDEAVAAFQANNDRGGPTALPGNCLAAAACAASGRIVEAEKHVRHVLEEQFDADRLLSRGPGRDGKAPRHIHDNIIAEQMIHETQHQPQSSALRSCLPRKPGMFDRVSVHWLTNLLRSCSRISGCSLFSTITAF